VQIGSADRAGVDADPKLAGARLGDREVDLAQWLALLLERHRVHEIDCRGNRRSPRTKTLG